MNDILRDLIPYKLSEYLIENLNQLKKAYFYLLIVLSHTATRKSNFFIKLNFEIKQLRIHLSILLSLFMIVIARKTFTYKDIWQINSNIIGYHISFQSIDENLKSTHTLKVDFWKNKLWLSNSIYDFGIYNYFNKIYVCLVAIKYYFYQ